MNQENMLFGQEIPSRIRARLQSYTFNAEPNRFFDEPQCLWTPEQLDMIFNHPLVYPRLVCPQGCPSTVSMFTPTKYQGKLVGFKHDCEDWNSRFLAYNCWAVSLQAFCKETGWLPLPGYSDEQGQQPYVVDEFPLSNENGLCEIEALCQTLEMKSMDWSHEQKEQKVLSSKSVKKPLPSTVDEVSPKKARISQNNEDGGQSIGIQKGNDKEIILVCETPLLEESIDADVTILSKGTPVHSSQKKLVLEKSPELLESPVVDALRLGGPFFAEPSIQDIAIKKLRAMTKPITSGISWIFIQRLDFVEIDELLLDLETAGIDISPILDGFWLLTDCLVLFVVDEQKEALSMELNKLLNWNVFGQPTQDISSSHFSVMDQLQRAHFRQGICYVCRFLIKARFKRKNMRLFQAAFRMAAIFGDYFSKSVAATYNEIMSFPDSYLNEEELKDMNRLKHGVILIENGKPFHPPKKNGLFATSR